METRGFTWPVWYAYLEGTPGRRGSVSRTENLVSALPQVSDGGVHSHINHLFAFLECAKEAGVPEAYVHFFGDGRDTAPRSSGWPRHFAEIEGGF